MMRLVLFVALLCLPVIAAGQVEQQKGESTISGRVAFADDGKPVRRATVRLFSNLNYRPLRTTPANVRGEFRFNEVAAGSYFVVAQAPGAFSANENFTITDFGLNNDADPEHTRVSVDGKGAVRCEVRVVRGGSIRGTIVYSDKEPVTGAPISLFRRKDGASLPVFFPEPILTNDRGMYRIDGLPEGEYLVGVVDSKRRVASDRPQEARNVVTAYYPGVVSVAEAKSVQVQSGSEVRAINMTLADDALRQISGVVKWRDGGKPATATLFLRKRDEPKVEASFEHVISSITAPGTDKDDTIFRDIGLIITAMPPSTEGNAKGEWKFEDLPPGKYLVTAYASLADKDKSLANDDDEPKIEMPSMDEMKRAQTMISREIELTVGNEDLKDVVLELSEGGRISGVVVAEDSPMPSVRISVGQIRAVFDNVMTYVSENNGSFLLESVPTGDVRLEIFFPSDEDMYVKSITLGSVDLMRNTLRVQEDTEVTGVRITVAKGLATLTGRALFDEGGSLAAGSGVLLVKADPALWRSPGARAFTVTDPAGEFVLRCAPGDYLVFTWAAGNQPMQAVEEFVRTNAASARRITLQSREQKQIEVTVVKPKK